MSGGSYNYAFHKVEDLADEIREQGDIEGGAAPRELRKAFKSHLKLVAKALRAIEWNDSGDGDNRETEYLKAVLGENAGLEQTVCDARELILKLHDYIQEAERTNSLKEAL